MVETVWCLHDKRTGIYERPAHYRDDNVAQVLIKRDVTSWLNKGEITSEQLLDFQMVKIAVYDDETGYYTATPYDERITIELGFVEREDDEV